LIDPHFTAACMAVALVSVFIPLAGEHPGQPDRPGYVRRPADRAQRQAEHPTARKTMSLRA
jgi:hypothetical protein